MRDPVTDTLAIAAMPGLEDMAAAMQRAAPILRRSARHDVSLLILTGAARAFGSQEKAASALANAGLWDEVRKSAARVGRELPERPPSADQMDRLIRRAGEALAIDTERALNVASVQLAQSMGLLRPDEPLQWAEPLRSHHLTGDGSVAKPLSEVTEANKHERSRAADARNARTCDVYVGKPDPDDKQARATDQRQEANSGGGSSEVEENRKLGFPFVVVSTHCDRPHERIVFGFETYRDGNEIGAAMAVFDRVVPLAGGGVHTVHYDKLMSDIHMLQLMQGHGVIPLVEMRESSSKTSELSPKGPVMVKLDPDDPRFRRGKYGQYAPKARARGYRFGSFGHEVRGTGQCNHSLWMLDGELLATPVTQNVTQLTGAKPLVLLDVKRSWNGQRYEMHTTYQVPCNRHGDFSVTVDLAQTPVKGTHKNREPFPRMAADKVRILNERDPAFWAVAGRRSDSESTIEMIKGSMPLHGRASRLKLENFMWDLIGSALWINARAWDVHVAQHTVSGRAEYERQQRRFERTGAYSRYRGARRAA